MKEKISKAYPRRARKLLETKLYRRKLVKGINAWAVLLVRNSGPFLKWTREELKYMDQRTRNDVDRLYESRREGGRRLASIEESVDTSILRLEDYIVFYIQSAEEN